MVGLALAFCAGAVLIHQGVPFSWTLLSLLLLLRPRSSSRRPESSSHPPGPSPGPPESSSQRPASSSHPLGWPTRGSGSSSLQAGPPFQRTRLSGPLATHRHLSLPSLVLALLAGALLTSQWRQRQGDDCRVRLPEGASLEVQGRTLGRVVEARGQLRVREGLPGGCRTTLRFVLTSRIRDGAAATTMAPGTSWVLSGRWMTGGWAPGQDPLRAGYLRVQDARLRESRDGGWKGLAGLRAGIQSRLGELFPSQGPLVEALVLARKERLRPEIRDAFARAGVAHLLAISGFHVGVVAGLLLLAGGWLGLPHPLRFFMGSLGVWFYVLLIGIPDAALRAAFILSLLAVGRVFRRPVAPMGALGSAFLLFLVADPGALLRVGFQLSFAGAFGLVAWSRPVGGSLEQWPALRGRRVLATGLAAGAAATLATLPLVAWHFGRVSLVGIPVTLLATPLITLAIPGIILSLLASLLHPGLGRFIASGVEMVLWALTRGVEWVATLPFASLWVSRPAVVAGCAGLLLGFLIRKWRAPGSAPTRSLLPAMVLTGVLLWPLGDLALNRGTLEIVALDVGQGDALAIRSPAGRWILVDAGPRTETFDAGARRVLPYLRQRGVRELTFLILTHPDMDHVGGSGSILREFPVSAVLDPGRVVGSQVFLDALQGARTQGVSWRVVRAGDSLNLDGVALRVLWPPPAPGERDDREGVSTARRVRELALQGSNEASVVLELRYGDFSALLTGDATAEVEEAVLPLVLSPRVGILKVGHHGSVTSTSPELLERLDPEAAVISVGRRNRYGHPHGVVLRRMEEARIRIYRTDLDGTLRIRGRRDGSFQVSRPRP